MKKIKSLIVIGVVLIILNLIFVSFCFIFDYNKLLGGFNAVGAILAANGVIRCLNILKHAKNEG